VARLDVASFDIDEIAGIDGANHLDPAWAPDGRSVYFVADPGGISNVFRIDLADHRLYRVTDVHTGVSGVTRISPVLSVASRSGAIAFSVFRRSGYEVRKLTGESELAGTAIDAIAHAGAKPSTPRRHDPLEPVPPLPAIPYRPAQNAYTPRLSLEGIGSPYLSGGGGPVGGYVAAGGSLLFGDLLGDHQLLTAIHVSSRFDESAVGAMYLNRRSRWNWGVTIDQTPDVRLRTHSVQAAPAGQQTVTRERDRFLWTNRHIGGVAAYPFSRALRVELTGGVRHIAFERERRTEIVSTLSGRILEQEIMPLASEASIGVFDAGVALIGDRAIFGATGPVLGSRYRLQAATTTGGLKYTSVLADYRYYAMPVRPYTIAMRVVHTGRFGPGADDFRLRDAYVGSPSLVRGYGPSSVVRAECAEGSTDCPALNSLLANRFVVAKLEVRVPLWSSLTSSSRIRYGMLPVDAFAFADAGTGWGGEQRFGAGGSDGSVFRSVGAGIRVNLFGLIFEAAAVRPLDLEGAGWSLGFNLRPGF
jgi:hypothetical protein